MLCENRAMPESVTFPPGISEKEALERLERYGENALLEKKKRCAFLKKVLLSFADVMTLVLFAAAAVSFTVAKLKGESAADSYMILAIVFLNGIVTAFQETRAEKALEALKTLTSPECTAVREGKEKRMPAKFLVPGDVILVKKGDSVPADAAKRFAARGRIGADGRIGRRGKIGARITRRESARHSAGYDFRRHGDNIRLRRGARDRDRYAHADGKDRRNADIRTRAAHADAGAACEDIGKAGQRGAGHMLCDIFAFALQRRSARAGVFEFGEPGGGGDTRRSARRGDGNAFGRRDRNGEEARGGEKADRRGSAGLRHRDMFRQDRNAYAKQARGNFDQGRKTAFSAAFRAVQPQFLAHRKRSF